MKQYKFILLLILPILALSSCAQDEYDMFGEVFGVVTNENGVPIAGVRVTLSYNNETKTTDTDGTYRFTNIEAGSHTIMAKSSAGYAPEQSAVSVKPGIVTQNDITLRKASGALEAPTNIKFGNTKTAQPCTLVNTGSGDLSWSIEPHTHAWIKPTNPPSGKIPAGKTESITIEIDRSKLTTTQETWENITIIADDGVRNISIWANGPITDAANTVASGLYGYYTFDYEDGQNIAGTAPDGLVYGEPTYELSFGKDEDSKALKLTPSSYITIGEGLIDDRGHSVSFWLKNISGQSTHIYSVDMNDSSISYKSGFGLSYESDKLVLINYNYYYSYSYLIERQPYTFDNPPINDNRWHMITITSQYTRPNMVSKLYVDGSYVNQITEDFGKFVNAEEKMFGQGTRFKLGGAPANTNSILTAGSMDIDNLRIYTRVITVDEIKQIYNAEK